MHDVVEFLRRHAPFEGLSDDELETLARSVEVEFFPAGTTIFRQGEGPMLHVRVVRRGVVELVNDGRVLDLLGEGELFGHPSMLSGLPTGFEARAGEDTLSYRLPAEAVVPLLVRPAGLRFVARSLLARPRPDPATPRTTLDPAGQPVSRLVRGRPVICEPGWSVRDTAQRMAEAEASAAIVRLADGELGIVTDRDLRDRVVAGEVGADEPVTTVMNAPVFTVTPERPGSEAMLEMLDRDVHHLPVVWPHGEVLGILTDRDLLAAETHAPFSLRRAIEDAADPGQLRRVVAQWRTEVTALHDAGVPPLRIGSIIAIVVDALTRRLIELAMRDLGEPPCPFTWLALGSLGRREIVPSSDIDSGLVWDPDGEEQQRYMRRLGPRIVRELAESGFTADAYGATAAEPLFLRSYDDWRSVIRTAIAEPDRGKALIFISLLADGRPVFGDGNPRDPIEELRHVRHRRPLLRLLLQLALAHGPPTGLRRLRVPRRDRAVDGKPPGRFDVKHQGVLPIASIARYASLAAGLRATSTRARLDLAATAGSLSARDASTLAEAYDLFWRLRLDHQVEQMRAGVEPDEYVDLEGLNAVMRGYVREAFHAVAAVQRSLQGELNLPP